LVISSSHRPFKSVLVANRGEIAARIAREARALGLRTIAVYSDADEKTWLAPHHVDAAVRIGAAAPSESYLNASAILEAAAKAKAEAIHPGYGFLSENADFAQSVIDAGLVWIGPSPDAIRAMGDKGAAKQIARKADVTVIPGYDGDDQSDIRLLAEAKKIGWPVLIKAANGGGGRGQRRVPFENDFADALASARRESLSAFASDKVILERALENARHVEVQVFGDAHGSIVHLGERDCSTQRRNQKVIEEAPAPGVSDELRSRMGDAAVRLATAVGYVNAGTVEFLLDPSGQFYFLEMNTRIQVEHPVTEEVTGLNLIAMQLGVAMGKPLGLKQSDVRISGHAIEARLCAEDPETAFAPQTGRVYLMPEARTGARVDAPASFEINQTADYDSMLAKVIGKGSDRDTARAALARGLRGLWINGLRTNRNFLVELVDDPSFAKVQIDIGWLSRRHRPEPGLSEPHATLAALYLANGKGSGWRSTGALQTIIMLRERNVEKRFVVEGVTLNGLRLIGDYSEGESNMAWCQFTDGTRTARFDTFIDGHRIQVRTEGSDALLEDITYAPAEPKDSVGDGAVRAPMAGKIVRVNVEPGAKVEKGQVLVILEAMKMEHEITARISGTVASVSVKTGDQATNRQVLATITTP